MPRTLVYVAGKYSGDIDANIQAARDVAIDLWRHGLSVICPHLNTAHFEVDGIGWEDYLDGDEEMVLRCDAIVMLPNWEQSKGATREHEFAKSNGVPIYYYPDFPEVHPTVRRSPIQARAFLSEVMKMYRVHLDKNADYSPANILGTGTIGLYTRLWDKMARLMNLAGFRLELSAPATFTQPKQPKHESIEDNLRDMSVYAVIGQLLRRGEWGR